MKIVLDTNVLLQAISSRSIHHWIWEAMRDEKFTLCVTTDIILEYEEVIAQKRNVELAKLVVDVILSMPNLVRVEVYFNFGLPVKDPDDQKFTDCAIACGADYLVTEDQDFHELRKLAFPPVRVVSPSEFRKDFEGR
jgi:putative PIN family toxin of toxin-antitoxin system